jgi:RNA polymerase sigma-70 factor (ECF subfamily)
MKGLAPRRQPVARVSLATQTCAELPLELAAVYDAYAATVARWASRLAGPRLDAEDLVHEVFLTVHRELPHFRGDAKITTWLYRITDNIVRDRRRKELRRWRRHRLVGGEADRAPAGPTPLEQLERQREAALVYRVLDAMKERYRTVLILFAMEGLSGEAIAELTATRLETVWVWLHRAREQFRARLAKLDPDAFDSLRRGA